MSHRIRVVSEEHLHRFSSYTARQYFSAVVAGKTDHAKALIRERVNNADDLREVYFSAFLPVHECIAAMREESAITVVQQHFMMMTTQELLDEFAPLVFSSQAGSPRAMVTTAPAEIDDTKARIIADVLELDGIDTHFLSSPRDAGEVCEALSATQADLLIVSVSREEFGPGALDLVSGLQPRLSGTAVLLDAQAGCCPTPDGGVATYDTFAGADEAIAMARRRLGLDRPVPA